MQMTDNTTRGRAVRKAKEFPCPSVTQTDDALNSRSTRISSTNDVSAFPHASHCSSTHARLDASQQSRVTSRRFLIDTVAIRSALNSFPSNTNVISNRHQS